MSSTVGEEARAEAANDKTRGAVLITGASTGIGRATALHLAGLGFRVFAGVRREADATALREAAPGVEPLILDVTDHATVHKALEQITTAAPEGLAGLVNNAGIAVGGALEFVPVEELRRQFEVNVIGAVVVTQAALESLRRARGRVVNIGSIGGRSAGPFIGPYAASKFALEGLTDSLRRELRPWGIEVSVVEPGAVATPIWDKGKQDLTSLRTSLPPRALELYGPVLDGAEKVLDRQARAGVAPEVVARTVAHALTARRPRTRYLVGMEARATVMAKRLLSDRGMDRLIARVMGI